MSRSLDIAQHVRCPAAVAYAYARDPAHLSSWAAGLGGPVVRVDGQWLVRAPDGDVLLHFTPDDDEFARDAAAVAEDLRTLRDVLEAGERTR